MAVPQIVLAALSAATLGGVFMQPVEQGGVLMSGRARNESCSITTDFRSTDGRDHVVVVNQHPKWGDPTVVVPAGGQVTVVVNGDFHGPYLVSVDGVTVERPVPDVTPDGHDCSPEPPPTSTTFATTPVPVPLVPQAAPPTTTGVPWSGGSTTTTPPLVVGPPTPDIDLVSDGPECGPETLPCTGSTLVQLAGIVGAALAATGLLLLAGIALVSWYRKRGQ